MTLHRFLAALFVLGLSIPTAEAGPRYGYNGQFYDSHAEVMAAADSERRAQLDSVRASQRPLPTAARIVVPDRAALKEYLIARSGQATIDSSIRAMGLTEQDYWSQMLDAQAMTYRFPAELLERRHLFDSLDVVEGGFGPPEGPAGPGLTIWQTPLSDGIDFRVRDAAGKEAAYTFKPRHGSPTSAFERWRQVWLMEFEAFLKVQFLD